MSEPGVAAMGVIKKRAVAVDGSLGSLMKYMSDPARVERWCELAAVRVLNAMDRPENLFYAVESNAIAGFFARMICREAAVIGRMPIFRGKNQLEARLQFIGEGDDLITMRHRQRPARQKIILKIDEDSRVHYDWLAQSISIVTRA